MLVLIALASLLVSSKGLSFSQQPRFIRFIRHHQHQRVGTIRYNVWSNPQAVEDYQALLSGVVEEATTDTDAVLVVGKGTHEVNLAKTLARLNPRGNDVCLEMGAAIPDTHPVSGNESFPVYLCISAAELKPYLDSGVVADKKRDDLVFLSDGFIEPILKARGLCNKKNTQAVLWFNFNEYGVAFDGRTSQGPNANGITEWCGETVVTGKWAGALTERLSFGELFCETKFYRDWRRLMLERVGYLAVFNLIGCLHPNEDGKPCTHRDVATFWPEEVDEMIQELSYTLRGYLAVTFLLGTTGRLITYANTHGTQFPAVVTSESFEASNGLFWDNAMLARDRGFPDTCPTHTEYCEYAAYKGLFKLPGDRPVPPAGEARSWNVGRRANEEKAA